jgi:hypothetical protein
MLCEAARSEGEGVPFRPGTVALNPNDNSRFVSNTFSNNYVPGGNVRNSSQFLKAPELD